MRSLCTLALLTVLSAVSLAKDSRPRTYGGASGIWERVNDTVAYQTYVSEFVRFNNSLHLVEKDGCYSFSSDPVDLMLVITHPDHSEFAVVVDVLTKIDSPKARCFQKSYRGISTKVPPFVPFVLQMSFR